jgi:acyl carrier protein
MIEKITKILKEYKEDDSLVISADTTFESLALDSIDTAELVMNIEEELDVTIEMDEAIKTVGDLLRVIEK